MKKALLFTWILVAMQSSTLAQSFERCASHLCAQHKGLVFDYEKLPKTNFQKQANVVDIVIPVVVHVVHNQIDGAIEGNNISQEQIESQIARLNTDFGSLNPELNNIPDYFKDITNFDGVGIQFKLAEIDPEGNPTNGVTRTYTSKESFSYELDDIKNSETGGAEGWNRNQYLNIWVAPSINNGGALGYAQFPNPTDDPLTDGLTVAHNYFGNNTGTVNPTNSEGYYKGRTLVHEMGHFFGLIHIWGNDNGTCVSDDGVIDTPKQADSYYGCPQEGVESCESKDMFMNFMDYTDDECMYAFTNQQAERIYEVLNTHPTRIGLVTAGEIAFAECAPKAGNLLPPNEFNVCFGTSTESLNIINGNDNYLTIWLITQPNGTVEGYQIGETVSFANYPAGYYGVSHINCQQNQATQIFNLIDSGNYTVVSLKNALSNNGLCADVQLFGYPLFTHLSQAQSTGCTTNTELEMHKKWNYTVSNGVLEIKAITEEKLIEVNFFNLNGQLLAQHKKHQNTFDLPIQQGIVLAQITINNITQTLKIYCP